MKMRGNTRSKHLSPPAGVQQNKLMLLSIAENRGLNLRLSSLYNQSLRVIERCISSVINLFLTSLSIIFAICSTSNSFSCLKIVSHQVYSETLVKNDASVPPKIGPFFLHIMTKSSIGCRYGLNRVCKSSSYKPDLWVWIKP